MPSERARRRQAGGAGRRSGRGIVDLRAAEDAIGRTLIAHHKSHPLSEGIPREELREQLFARGHGSVRSCAVGFVGC
jgi:hypothetical protein